MFRSSSGPVGGNSSPAHNKELASPKVRENSEREFGRFPIAAEDDCQFFLRSGLLSRGGTTLLRKARSMGALDFIHELAYPADEIVIDYDKKEKSRTKIPSFSDTLESSKAAQRSNEAKGSTSSGLCQLSEAAEIITCSARGDEYKTARFHGDSFIITIHKDTNAPATSESSRQGTEEGELGMYEKVVSRFRKSFQVFLKCLRGPAAMHGATASILPDDMAGLGQMQDTTTKEDEDLSDNVELATATSPITSVAQSASSSDESIFALAAVPHIDFARLAATCMHPIKPLLKELHPSDQGKKCLVLDLDETLVHSSFQACEADLVLDLNVGPFSSQQIYVSKRPGVDEFLQRVGEVYEVVIFTASLPNYADPVIDFLDRTRTVKHRLYRDSCVFLHGLYIKDLSRLGRPLSDILIIDNAPASYLLHPEYALPIRSWFSDRDDTELLKMLPILEWVAASKEECSKTWKGHPAALALLESAR